MKSEIAIPLLLALAPIAALAQSPSRGLSAGDVATEHIAGYSWFSPGGRLGDVTDRHVFVTGIRRSWTNAASRRVAVAYTAEWVPVIVVKRTLPNNRTCWIHNLTRVCRLDRSASISLGSGVSPIGTRLYYNASRRWRAHIGGSAGAALFSSEMPIYDSGRFNFMFEYGGAIEIPTGDHRDFVIGYKFHHLSNAGTQTFNPGLDANVVYLGLSTRKLSR